MGADLERGVRAVVFDVGETLIDETREWGAWADWLGVPRLTLFAALGSVIERGGHHMEAFELVRPGFDLETERAARDAAGVPEAVDPSQVYPDVADCLATLHAEGYLLGVAGNAFGREGSFWQRAGLPFDVVTSASELGAEKPSPRFFSALAERMGLPPREIAYVGDRVDNDVVPAAEAGMAPIFLRRGPWGLVHARRPEVGLARAVVDDLRQVPAALRVIREAAAS